ncbi:hypothetical protein D3C86_1641060 [compost metagenome]
MHHIAQIDITGIAGKNMPIGVIEKAQHAGELLHQIAVLAIGLRIPLRRGGHLVHIKTGERAKIIFQHIFDIVMPLFLDGLNIQTGNFTQRQVRLDCALRHHGTFTPALIDQRRNQRLVH